MKAIVISQLLFDAAFNKAKNLIYNKSNITSTPTTEDFIYALKELKSDLERDK